MSTDLENYQIYLNWTILNEQLIKVEITKEVKLCFVSSSNDRKTSEFESCSWTVPKMKLHSINGNNREGEED